MRTRTIGMLAALLCLSPVTMALAQVKTKTEPTGPEATYLLVALNLLMLVGILVMLVTGRRETEDKKRKRPRRIKRVAVRKVSRMKARDPMVVASEEE